MTFPKKSWLCSVRQAVSFTSCIEEHWKHSLVPPGFPLLHLHIYAGCFFYVSHLYCNSNCQPLSSSYGQEQLQPKQGSAATLQEIPADHTAMYKLLDPRAGSHEEATGTPLGNTANLAPWSKYQSTRTYQNLIKKRKIPRPCTAASIPLSPRSQNRLVAAARRKWQLQLFQTDNCKSQQLICQYLTLKGTERLRRKKL